MRKFYAVSVSFPFEGFEQDQKVFKAAGERPAYTETGFGHRGMVREIGWYTETKVEAEKIRNKLVKAGYKASEIDSFNMGD